MPADQKLNVSVEIWPIDRLVPYARNPRKNDAAVDRMAASIQEFGFKVPILARTRTGEIVDGHLRLKGAVKLGYTEAAVIPCDDWTDAQVKAFRLLANRSVNWAEWDEELLALELQDLKSLDFDLDLTGFDAAEIADMLGGVDEETASGGSGAGSLADRFLVPPFSILDARQGYWQERKRAWLSLGIKSEIGRGEGSSPGGSARPACDYSERERGDGAGKPMRSKMALANDPMQRKQAYSGA